MHINYNDNNDIESIEVEPYGDERKEIEKAAQRQFKHKNIEVTRSTFTKNGLEYVNVKINNGN